MYTLIKIITESRLKLLLWRQSESLFVRYKAKGEAQKKELLNV